MTPEGLAPSAVCDVDRGVTEQASYHQAQACRRWPWIAYIVVALSFTVWPNRLLRKRPAAEALRRAPTGHSVQPRGASATRERPLAGVSPRSSTRGSMPSDYNAPPAIPDGGWHPRAPKFPPRDDGDRGRGGLGEAPLTGQRKGRSGRPDRRAGRATRISGSCSPIRTASLDDGRLLGPRLLPSGARTCYIPGASNVTPQRFETIAAGTSTC
jgi:hypothetical protein